ncbi:Hypothetical predicted protein [Olea europaea subsp. europaea]|uniref:Uncharacterized protein n=1 Tax=Olea europaea subsp. europaea TaxID=158383 RepID=A0A8S0QJG8_OLEEU|nr:Hypothetical predicted protein [Olea europaea subsp. europaea]
MTATRMDNRIEVLENAVAQIQPLGTSVIALKGDLEQLNARLGMELSKMNERLEVSLTLGRKELNEGLQALAKMFKGMSPESSVMTGEGSRMKSTGLMEEVTESEVILPKKMINRVKDKERPRHKGVIIPSPARVEQRTVLSI